ncbi:MAG TPA: DUF1499 domain-containing protein [Burkholderiales bacterium]
MQQVSVKDPARFRRAATGIVWTGAGLAVAFAAAEISSVLGYRDSWWDYRTGLSILRFAGWGAVAATVVLLAGCISAGLARSRVLGVVGALGLAIGATGVAVPGYFCYTARNAPNIHDITTDTADPPRFHQMNEARMGPVENSLAYAPETAAEQKRGYPDIAPARLALPPQQAFDRALEVGRGMGWLIVSAVQHEGRIEATATTPLFGLKEDITVRVTPEDGGSRVDIRSCSRVGSGDFGTNAARVREFLAQIAARP